MERILIRSSLSELETFASENGIEVFDDYYVNEDDLPKLLNKIVDKKNGWCAFYYLECLTNAGIKIPQSDLKRLHDVVIQSKDAGVIFSFARYKDWSDVSELLY